MRPALVAVLAVAAVAPVVAAAGCADPTIDVAIVYAPTADPDDDPDQVGALPAHVETLVLSVIALDGATCEQVAYGELSAEVLAGARKSSVTATADARLAGVPRLGDKLILLDGYMANQRRVAGGCVAIGDIDGDTTATIAATLAPRLLLVPNGAGRDPGAPPDEVLVAAREPWAEVEDSGGVPAWPLRITRRDARTDGLRLADAVTGAEGGVAIAMDVPAPAPGPVELEVRAAWSDDVLRIPAFAPVGLTLRTLTPGPTPRDLNRVPPRWAISTVETAPLRAAGLSQRATGATQLVLFDWATGAPAIVGTIAADLHAIAVWPDAAAVVPGAPAGDLFVTRLGGVWQYVDWTTRTLVAIPGVATELLQGSADELIPVMGCGQGAIGLLARNSNGPYLGYASPGVRSQGQVDEIARSINTMLGTVDVIGQACLPSGTGGPGEPAVVVRAVTERRTQVTVVSVARDVRIPAISGVASFVGDGQLRLVGGEFEVDGPRAVAYKIVYLIGGGRDGVALEVDALDHQLGAPPTSFVIGDLDGDQRPDTIAAIAAGDVARVQVTYARAVDGRPLSGVTGAIFGRDPLVQVRRRGTEPPILIVTTTEVIASMSLEGAL